MDRILDVPLDQLRRERTSVKWQVYPPDVLPVWVAEMDVKPCPAVVDAVSRAMHRGDTGYTWMPPLAEAMAEFSQDRWGWGWETASAFSVPDVMIGVAEVLQLLTSVGDPVMVSTPVYTSFFGFIESIGRRAVEVPLTDGRLDEGPLAEAFAAATAGGRRAAYLLCNPQNPVGTVHTPDELAMVARVAEAHGVRVVSDEIHAPIVHTGATFTPYLSVTGAERGFALLSASKAWNLAGLKSALLIAGPEARGDLARMHEVVTHGASHVAAIAHAAAFGPGREWLDQLLTELDANRRLVAALVSEQLPDVGYAVPDGTYLAWLDFRRTDLGDDPAQVLIDRGRVALAHGPSFGEAGRGFARLNFATSPDIVREAVARIAGVVAG